MTSAASAVARLVPAIGRRRRGGWLWRSKQPRVWAHRGVSAHATENTIAAFELAVAHGAGGVELDVQLCASGEVVVFHDIDLLRLAERGGRIDGLNWSTLARVDLPGGQRICRLEEALAACADLPVNVEIKVTRPSRGGALAAAVAKIIRDERADDRVVISSFDPLTLLQIHGAAPHLPTAFLFEQSAWRALRSRGIASLVAGASAVHPEHLLCTPDYVATWHRRGFAVNVWTVDDPIRLRQLAAAGVDGVFANDPRAALAALTSAAPKA